MNRIGVGINEVAVIGLRGLYCFLARIGGDKNGKWGVYGFLDLFLPLNEPDDPVFQNGIFSGYSGLANLPYKLFRCSFASVRFPPREFALMSMK